MKHIVRHLTRFERAFNRRFGWFFTNGNKQVLPCALLLLTLSACHFERACGTVLDKYEIMHEHHVSIRTATGERVQGTICNTCWASVQLGDTCCVNVTRWGTFN